MSRLSLNAGSKPASNDLKSIVTQLDAALTRSTARTQLGDINVASLESLNSADFSVVNNVASEMEQLVLSSFGLEDIFGQSDEVAAQRCGEQNKVAPTHAQRQAAVIAALAGANPVDYVKSAYSNLKIGAEGANVLVPPVLEGSGGALDYRDELAVGLEAFDETELRRHVPFSIAFNFAAARQDEFGEAFYKTVVVTPDQAGLDIAIRRSTIYNTIRHRANGTAADFKRKNLIDAFVDASILENESTYLWPVATSESADKLVDEAQVGTVVQTVEGVQFETAPLRANTEIDLIGISSHPGLIEAGLMNETDSIDARVALKNVYFAVGTDANAPVVRFHTLRLPRSGFNKTVEGHGREMGLQFSTKDLVIDGTKRSVDGSEIPALAAIGENNFTVRLGARIGGVINLETGNVEVFGNGKVDVVSIVDEDGNAVSTTGGVGAAIVSALADLTFVGYDLEARRTNSNKRTRGLLVESVEWVERYTIPLGSPISTPAPIASTRDNADMANLIAAARIRNSNNAVTTLLNYAETLQTYVTSNLYGKTDVPEVEGIGRFLVKPWFERRSLDVTKLNSLSSADRAEDLRAVLVNQIRDMAYRAYRDSHYQAALDTMTGGVGVKPTLVIGTDPLLVRHIMVGGDSRTLGIGMNYKVVTSLDSRMSGKIVFSFVREDIVGEPDPLSFGLMAWIPELTSSVQMNRGGATYKETMVQPRSRHINVLPVLGMIDVQNLTEGLLDRTSIWVEGHINTTEVPNPVEEPTPPVDGGDDEPNP